MSRTHRALLMSAMLSSFGLLLAACGATGTRSVTSRPAAPAPTEPGTTATTPTSPVAQVAPTAAIAADLVQPIAVGQTLPALGLRTADDLPFDLQAGLAKQPAVLIFFRGGWCPYCARHLSALREIEPELVELGFQVLAVSPERPEVLAAAAKPDDAGFRLLSDSDMSAARALGLAFRVDDATVETYRGFGVDLDALSGEQHHELPVPAALVVGRDGVVRFVHVNPDYRQRIEPAALLAAARAAAP